MKGSAISFVADDTALRFGNYNKRAMTGIIRKGAPGLLGAPIIFVMVVSCAAKGPNFVVEENTRCSDCSRYCEELLTHSLEPCQCVKCSEFGVDAENTKLLRCCDKKWKAVARCPNGASVECQEKGGYKFECIDEYENDVPLLSCP